MTCLAPRIVSLCGIIRVVLAITASSLATAFALAACAPSAVHAQDSTTRSHHDSTTRAARVRPSVAVVPDSGYVGDPYRVAVRLQVPKGIVPLFPDTLDILGDVENTARSRVQVDSSADGFTYTATYSLTGWRTGTLPLPTIAITLSGTDSSTITAALPPLQIFSVLPADTSGIDPKPPHDVWGESRLWWPLVVAAVLLLLAVAALVWWLHKRRANRPVLPAAIVESPRERVLRELAALEERRWIERGEWKRYYSELSDILRRYLAANDRAWSPDLTTRELAGVLGPDRDRVMPALRVFERADLVKFARQHVSAVEARADLQESREWAQHFEQPMLEVAA